MNPRRVAALLRELADELDGGASAEPPASEPPPAPPAKKRRRTRVVHPSPPPNEPTDLGIARARAAARRAGIVIP